MDLLTNSDKHFWHRYTDIYRDAFQRLGTVGHIFEFGVYHGASIRWLASLFPDAEIIGADILPVQNDWPRADRITYERVDQADRSAVRSLLSGYWFDLIIEDGSHVPEHQATCLAEGLPRVRPGGLYILEDIHTSHPQNRSFSHRGPNSLHLLLALQHLMDLEKSISYETIISLSHPSFFSADDILHLSSLIDKIDIFKRTRLPLRCYACNSSDFDYAVLRCRCGVELYDLADSMTALVWRRPG